jgi:hypothetical protein
MAFFGVGRGPLSGALIALAIVSCGKGPPKPGFEEVGGSGGDSTSTVASTSVSSTHATTGVTTSANTTVSSSATSTVASSSSGPICNDPGPGEPNDTEPTATSLGAIGDCDDEGDMISGVLDGPTDADWYKIDGNDASSFCVVDPSRSLQSSSPVRLCKFIQCKNGESTNFSCPGGTTPATSPQGRPGCCSMGGFTIGDLGCGGSTLDSDNSTIYLRLDNPQGAACPSYTVAYHY